MRKMKWLFPLMFVVAFAGSAFTRQSTQQKKTFGYPCYYQDANDGYCDSYFVNDDNCTPDLMGPVCEEFILDNDGWTIIFAYGTSVVCWQPFYSLYPNNPF